LAQNTGKSECQAQNGTMSDIEKPKIEELADELALWNTYRELRRSKGLDVDKIFAELADEQRTSLNSPGARDDFTELCNAGCLPLALSALVALVRFSPLLEEFWIEIVGHPENREKAARNLENVVQTLQGLFGKVVALEREGKNSEFAKMGRLSVSQVIAELQFYIRFINFAESFSAEKEIRSPQELSKYLLTSYVGRMTGRFHDRCVSSILGEVTDFSEYNEVAHRMWRSRNYDRLEKNFSWMTRFLVAMSVVIAHTT
jgi:hypothetical protein